MQSEDQGINANITRVDVNTTHPCSSVILLPIRIASLLVKFGALIIIATGGSMLVLLNGELSNQIQCGIYTISGVVLYLIGIGLQHTKRVSIFGLLVYVAFIMTVSIITLTLVFPAISLVLFSFTTLFFLIPLLISFINWRYFY